MISNSTTFAPGDKVGWADPGEHIIEHYGEGPFYVIRVVAVPVRQCTCGAAEDYFVHFPECETRIPNLVGHHQRVVLCLKGEERELSGALIKRV